MNLSPSRIAKQVRALRVERHWTQARLARELGLSQSRLSEIETGGGSFTAEQFLRILELFNVSVDRFARRKAEVGYQLQNALARLGAAHLAEGIGVLPSERLSEAATVIREVLLSPGWPRQVAALAPVLVLHAAELNLSKLADELAVVGRERRLFWVVDSVVEALRREEDALLPREWRLRYRRALAVLEGASRYWRIQEAAVRPTPDILDADIASAESVAEVSGSASEVAKRWNIVTRLETDDFVAALRQARESR